MYWYDNVLVKPFTVMVQLGYDANVNYTYNGSKLTN